MTYHVVTTASVGSEKHTGQADVSGLLHGAEVVLIRYECVVLVWLGFC